MVAIVHDMAKIDRRQYVYLSRLGWHSFFQQSLQNNLDHNKCVHKLHTFCWFDSANGCFRFQNRNCFCSNLFFKIRLISNKLLPHFSVACLWQALVAFDFQIRHYAKNMWYSQKSQRKLLLSHSIVERWQYATAIQYQIWNLADPAVAACWIEYWKQ